MTKIIIASGPVIVENGKVLLNKNGEDGFWKFCGGKVEDFTTDLAENARREVKEEMGFAIDIIDERPYLMHVKKPGEEGVDVILVHFLAKRVGDITPGDEITAWKWFAVNDLPDDVAPNIKPVLEYFKFI
ncbi:MAG: NUDIX hydrolase [Patescibacteria group bacterium]